MATLTVKRGRAKPLWFGHPWLFSEAIEKVEGEPQPGDDVAVQDHDGRFIGRGFYSPGSQIRVRVATRREEPLDAAWLKARIADARALRARLGLPSADTDAFRLVSSEGDALPGLTVDLYGEAAVVQFGTIGMKRREEVIFDALAEVAGARSIYEAAAGGVAKVEGFTATARVVRGESHPRLPVRENGLRYEIDPLGGQKTGTFLDQRENRLRVARLSQGARVLDLYCYVGGFTMAALRAGAQKVTAVDASARALERARAHLELNGLPAGAAELVEEDAFRWLEQAPPEAFDVVVCDPPKFARARKDVEAALKGYRRLNGLAIATVAPGGFLCTASCSQLVSEADFERALAGAAHDARRRLQVVDVASQAPDHVVPVSFPEGRYLKFLVCRVS